MCFELVPNVPCCFWSSGAEGGAALHLRGVGIASRPCRLRGAPRPASDLGWQRWDMENRAKCIHVFFVMFFLFVSGVGARGVEADEAGGVARPQTRETASETRAGHRRRPANFSLFPISESPPIRPALGHHHYTMQHHPPSPYIGSMNSICYLFHHSAKHTSSQAIQAVASTQEYEQSLAATELDSVTGASSSHQKAFSGRPANVLLPAAPALTDVQTTTADANRSATHINVIFARRSTLLPLRRAVNLTMP